MSFGFPNKKGADQPVHLRSLIRAFVIRVVEGIIHLQCTNSLHRQLVLVCNVPVSWKAKRGVNQLVAGLESDLKIE